MLFVGYARVSTKEQGDSRNGLEAQANAMRSFCEAGGHTLSVIIEDVASGKLAPEVRPGLSRAMDLARRQKGASVLVSKLDRLSRDVEVIAGLMNRTPFVTVEDGVEADRFVLHVKAGVAEGERRTGGQRTRAALQAKKARGEPLGMHTHRDPLVSGPKARAASAVAVKANADAHALHVAPTLTALRRGGLTLAQVADELNRLQVATPRGGQWYASGVCNTLARIKALHAEGTQ